MSEPVSYFLPPHLSRVAVIEVTESRQRCSAYQEAYTVATLFQGASEFYFRRRSHEGPGGTQLLMEPGEFFRHLRVPLPETAFIFSIDAAVVREAAEALGLRTASPGFRSTVWRDAALFRAFSRLRSCLHENGDPLEQQSRFTNCLRGLLNGPVDSPSGPPVRPCNEPRAVRRACEYINGHFGESITLSKLSEAAGLNSFYLLRAFTRTVGLAPHQYLIQLRIARARQLLSSGEAPAHVASTLGFFDQSHLNRHFKRSLGVTPGDFARSARVGKGKNVLGPRRYLR
jgi:AraC-like DNA-binding protein